jgi:hypothetical protein
MHSAGTSRREIGEALVWSAACPTVYIVALAVAAAFATAGGWKSHVQLPGVMGFALSLVVCVTAFLRISWRHWWAKVTVMAFFIFSAQGALHTLGFYWLFALGHWRE